MLLLLVGAAVAVAVGVGVEVGLAVGAGGTGVDVGVGDGDTGFGVKVGRGAAAATRVGVDVGARLDRGAARRVLETGCFDERHGACRHCGRGPAGCGRGAGPVSGIDTTRRCPCGWYSNTSWGSVARGTRNVSRPVREAPGRTVPLRGALAPGPRV
jgi:hypothetical protein